MPVFVAAGAAYLIGTAVGSAVLVSLAVSLAISGVAQLFAKKPESAGGFNSSLNITSTAPDDARLVAYGRTRTAGKRLFAETTNGNKKLYLVHKYADHEINRFLKFYADGAELNLDIDGNEAGKFAGHLRVVAHLGRWDQAADAWLVASAPSWTAEHPVHGSAYAIFELIFDQTLYGQGIPTFTAEFEGRKVYDQRDETQDPDEPDTWLYSNNWALCIQDYYRGVPMRFGAGTVERKFGVNAPDAFISFDEIALEANICDEDVPLAAGGTQKRYTINGVVSTAREPNDVLPLMLAAGAGSRIDNGGMLSLQCGAARTPVVHLSDADLRGPRALRPTRPMAQLFNGVKSTIRGPDSDFVIVDVPPFQDAALIAHDGRESWLDLQQEFVDDAARAQRLQIIALGENRRQESGDLPLNLTGFKLRAGSWFTYTLPSRGWDHKVFLCQTHRIATGADDKGAVLLGVDITMQAIDGEVYSYSSDMEVIVPPATGSNLPNPFYAPDPTAISGEVIEFRDRALVELTLTPDPAGVNMAYQFQWKLPGDVAWTPLPDSTEPVRRTYLDVGTYRIRGRSIASPFGGPSNWIEADLVIGAPVMTPRVTNLVVVGGEAGDIFLGPDPTITWREGSVNASSWAGGLDATNGADINESDPWRDGFQINIHAITGEFLRGIVVYDTNYTYPLHLNRADAARVLGSSVPLRQLKITVQQRARYGQEVQLSAVQTIRISNPSPAVPTGLRVTPFSRSIWLDFLHDDDGDLLGTIVRGSATPGFDAASGGGDLLYDGNHFAQIPIEVEPDVPLYLQVACFDAFGKTGLNWSSEIRVTSQGIGASEFAVDELSAISGRIGVLETGQIRSKGGNVIIDLDDVYEQWTV